MKKSWMWFGCCLLLAAMPSLGADVGTITILDGKPKLLRGTMWHSLAEGVRIRDGDVIELPEKSQVQVEMNDGGALGVIGPGALYAVSATPRDAKQAGTAEFLITRGWIKLDTKPKATRLRVRAALGTITASDAAAVARIAPEGLDVFVESGAAKISEPGKADGSGGEIKAGGFAARGPGKPFMFDARAPSPFIGALPRDFMDPLPTRAMKFASSRVEPGVEREATYAEVQPWLSGPYRASFIKRFEPKLADPAFRAAAEANSKANPEWTSATKAKVEPPKEKEKEKEQEREKEKEKEKEKAPARTWHWPWERR
ncbi:MAG: hypothetical protein E6H67_16725 [Betaproteobacteria bacterium]|nr:MAG: hypothetical protein E6H67_16725 [Betaproteobacteria bacterium]